MSEFYSLLVVAWVVYLSETIWWVRERQMVVSGRTIGDFRAHYGPVVVVSREQGIFCPRVVPPFTYSFAFDRDTGRAAPCRNDRARVADAARNAMRVASRPKLVGEVIWAYVFVVIPLVIAVAGFLRTWLPLLGMLLAMIVVAVVTYRAAWRALHPDDPRGWRSHAALMVISPLSTIRAADHLTRTALRAYAPILAVATLARRDQALTVTRLAYFDGIVPDASKPATFERHEHTLVAPLTATEIFAPPDQENPQMRGYCPRCHVQLTRANGLCPDCGTIEISAFGAPVTS